MAGSDGDPSTVSTRAADEGAGARINAQLLELIRHRVATGFYDHPQVIDRIAREIHRVA
jgi:hypothetical protein